VTSRAPLLLLRVVAHRQGPVRCYACDQDATGACDRRRHYREDAVVPACERHATPGSALRVSRACFVCGGPWRRGSPVDDEGNLIHQACWDAQNAS